MKNFSFLLIFFIFPTFGFAQDLMGLLSSEAPATTLDLDGLLAEQGKVESGQKESGVSTQLIDASHRIYQHGKNQVSAGVRYQKLDFGSQIFANDFYNQQGSLSWRHQETDEKFFLTNVSFGSATDRPFKSARDNTISANAIRKLDPNWFVLLNYSNNRVFLNNIPLPGAFYVVSSGRTESLILGFPFLFWLKPLSENWSVRYLSFIPWTHRLKLLYTRSPWLRPYLALEQQPLTFFRHERDKDQSRIFWFERRASVGVETGLSRDFRIDLGTGYSFDRKLFEARNFSQKKDFLINVSNAWFFALNLRYRL